MIDQAVKQFDPSISIKWLDFESNIHYLPGTENATALIPCHMWTTKDHINDPKIALTHRSGDNDYGYETTGNYFAADSFNGWNSHVERFYDTYFSDEWLGFIGDHEAVAYSRADGGTTFRLGSVMNPEPASAEEMDFMMELQYDDEMDLPRVLMSDNVIILRWVGTEEGVYRPSEILTGNGEQQGEYARIRKREDSWGRFWFNFWIEK